MISFGVIFFFKQKTAYEMRISDWSSDVCSSDLLFAQLQEYLMIERNGLLAIDGDAFVISGGQSGLPNSASAEEGREDRVIGPVARPDRGAPSDRKSTRLNSSH